MPQTRSPWHSFIWLLAISLLIIPAASARAQELAYATLTVPDTSKFPSISTYLDAFDDQGNFITGLTTSEVSILENGEQVTPDTLERLRAPLSFVLAVNSDPALAVRDGEGLSRYTKMTEVLKNWAAAQTAANNPDQLALVWNGGVIGSHLSAADFKTRLESFDPVPRNSTNSLAALAFALDTAQESELGLNAKKSILLISGHLGLKDQGGVDELITRAKQAGVRIFVWIVDSKSFLEHPGSLVLQDLALATGGRYTTFTNNETLPDPEEWLGTLRNIYQITYTSTIRAKGPHSASAQVHTDSLALTSPSVSFPLDLLPPTTALLSAPIQIVRQNPESPFDLESFTPRNQEISMLVEFPDKLPRAIKRTALYVDGQKVAENTVEPLDRFTWDLTGYQASKEHKLMVEVEDVLGLSQQSAEVPVQVTVVEPPGGMAGLVLRNRAAVTISFMVLAGGVVLGVIVLGGRRSLNSLAERRKARLAQLDPVTQPVPVKAGVESTTHSNPFPWLRPRTAPPPAYFVRLTSDGAPGQGDPIPLNSREITFGTDPTQATIVLGHPSLSHLHARLLRSENNIFTLQDQNSTAGTWVNFELVSRDGCILKHGDNIHLGHLTFRFVMAKPPTQAKPTITHIKIG